MGFHQRTLIATIVLNVTLIHAAGLVLLNQPRAGQGVAPAGKSVQMRLAQAMPPAAKSTPWAAPTEAGALPTLPSEPEASPPTQATADEAQTEQTFPPFRADDMLANMNTDTDGPPPTSASGSEYIPRPQLSTPPRPSAPVIVPFPPEITQAGRYTATLALFIDETGVVRRVRIDGPSLPAPFEDAARDTFLQTRFSPGEVEGRQVKSLIRVEVVFDNSPIERKTKTPPH